MKTLIDLGAFRRPVDLSTGATFVPQMYNQIQNMIGKKEVMDEVDKTEELELTR